MSIYPKFFGRLYLTNKSFRSLSDGNSDKVLLKLRHFDSVILNDYPIELIIQKPVFIQVCKFPPPRFMIVTFCAYRYLHQHTCDHVRRGHSSWYLPQANGATTLF